MTKPFAAEVEAIRKEIKAAEDRQRKLASEIEGKQKALLERGLAHYASVLDGLRDQAVQRLNKAGKALADLGPEPQRPVLGSLDADTYADAMSEYHAALQQRDLRVQDISQRAFLACSALQHQANSAKREARERGLEAPDGVGYVPEHVRQHAQLSQLAHDFVQSLAGDSPWGSLTVATVERFVKMLSEPAPEPQAPNPIYGYGVTRPEQHDGNWLSRGWSRWTKALDEREAEAELAAKRAAGYATGETTQTMRDVEKYVAGLGTNGGRPLVSTEPKP